MSRIAIRYREKDLLAQLRNNNRNAFEYLYNHYSAALFGVILKIVKDEDKAADVLQDSFLKIWRGMASYSSERGTLFTWMLNIARNTAIDTLRVDAKTAGKIIRLDAIVEPEVGVADGWPRHALDMDVRSWVARLLPERRVPIELVYFQGYTHEEVAEKLSVPLGTIKSRIRKGLQELRCVFSTPELQLKIA
ncbi:sigma-70 family RNA polymerase sigma factor [Dyadobacter sp. CY261]|uniref:RNA polymerase sigma factor n=1 Tax=Dyadobacter sp. CY261 TaxID=2907203 RepID=UPI001F2005E6|nr:sigma-70 family RNA polymerase sigma factor [Dyadobacter sp. CY261]MCF0073331.1 sigma-70 family RNA polymerase sigma factor [Dyadobacter sp. CY261]